MKSETLTPDEEGVEAVVQEAANIAEEAAIETSAEDQALQLLQEELSAERQRYEELNNRFQRSTADFQNTLRRREKQASETIERASEHVVLKLLPVLDDFARALENLGKSEADEHASWLEGFQQIRRKLMAVLEDEGVTVIPLDGAFDPHLHEAITSEPSTTVESGHIIATLRVGYEQRGRVIRPALVRVAA